MLFNTYEFLLFFICVLCALKLASYRYRWLLLLIASYVFYASWRPSFLFWVLLSTIIDYTSGRVIGATKTPTLRKTALICSIVINISILFTFKYLDFFITNTVGLAGFFGIELPDYAVKLILPLGISFYTFQSLSYVIDVYTGRVKPETDLGIYALFVAFFPQLIAGPIGRAPHLLHQYKEPRAPTPSDVSSGLWLVGYGLFKKMCIADQVAPLVNGVYNHASQFNGSYLIIATVLFAFQIYCDFSGYSDIANGTARIMGYDLMTNFRQPYFSTSLTEFWHRWHISLSTWFRDYLYIPLGGSEVGIGRWAFNILAVFLISGVWHGAAWAFVLWGAIHGVGILAERAIRSALQAPRLTVICQAIEPQVLRLAGLVATTVVVLIGWVFFRAGAVDKALDILRRMTELGPLEYGTFKVLNLPSFELILTALNLSGLLLIDYLLWANSPLLPALSRKAGVQICLGVGLIYYIVFFGVFERIEFIYFQF